ncbi:hypothetical protein BJ138DRAFT_1097344 [Hygrophoropsis aurantiaca]|uniref:Uncharacterized protein n=1 Tax=Hygrophoropsis aurantiaca TaxID=72124 RepID=A0ACB8ASG4_9AGAM|nr:hypothetical protein BJ138DRAFT_1097344 [Hygrophoropsis aurantiaca]
MSFTNINDPAGVKALLEQLRSSQAWKESVSPDVTSDPDTRNAVMHTTVVPPKPREEIHISNAQVAAPSPSVASLLSQLKSSTAWSSVSSATGSSSNHARLPQPSPQPFSVRETPTPMPVILPESPVTPVSVAAASYRQDARSLTFQQALPHLTQMAEDPEFVASIARMRDEQKDLERQLWEERRAIHRKYEEKVKVARTKASMIGTGVSKHEADMLNDAFRKELHKFDTERVLIAWDGLASKQQHALEGLGVPTMFVTDSQADRVKQQRVIQVLEGIMG